MNKSIIIGRLTREPELRTTASGAFVCSFSLAVNRRFKNANGDYDTDFIPCVAWQQQADFLCRYFHKGSPVGIVGSIQTRNYDDKDGKKVFVAEVAVDEVHFVGSKKQENTETTQLPDNEGFVPMPDAEDPF